MIRPFLYEYYTIPPRKAAFRSREGGKGDAGKIEEMVTEAFGRLFEEVPSSPNFPTPNPTP